MFDFNIEQLPQKATIVHERLIHFLEKSHIGKIGYISENSPTVLKEFSNHSNINWTTFKAQDDSLVYSNLIMKAIDLFASEKPSLRIIDLGAGSSIPSIRALANSPTHQNIKFVAVELFEDALQTSKKNVSTAQMNDHFEFINQDMFAFLNTMKSIGPDEKRIIMSNPPYLPLPPGDSGDFYDTVNGGVDGANFLEKLLQDPAITQGQILGLEWSSLSNPGKILDLIDQGYEVIYTTAYRTPFGTYTGSSPMKEHLIDQRLKGEAIFYEDTQSIYNYMFIGTILRKR